MILGTPREANSLSPVPSAARPSRTARRMLFSFMARSRLPSYWPVIYRSEEHTSELQSHHDLVCSLLLDSPPTELSTLSLHDALPICSVLVVDCAVIEAGRFDDPGNAARGELLEPGA